MPASWPAGLPYAVSAQAYGVTNSGPAPVASQAQSGKIRMRPQFTLRISRLSYGWEWTDAQLAVWRAFLRDTLGDGTGEFTMMVWIQSARAYQTRTVSIVGGSDAVAEKSAGFDRTLVTCNLDVRNL
ncbi:hypothetical protein [Methylobacterium platani]|uniref:Phage tail protein n=2 Tax=Methylobacterium platani TaxID=427683 RepID=A0A179SFQ9_9HYPH|nr:hypothetical protein [Methylobacterium platani]KMO20385.1 hypothetical protein SQ03_05725 [Methylobacterium platani JCM 14648]OAS26282.1 hypothetical protein A5481_06070 [Methylobacterium platani]